MLCFSKSICMCVYHKPRRKDGIEAHLFRRKDGIEAHLFCACLKDFNPFVVIFCSTKRVLVREDSKTDTKPTAKRARPKRTSKSGYTGLEIRHALKISFHWREMGNWGRVRKGKNPLFVLQRIQLSLVKILIEYIQVLRLILKAGRDRDVTLREREIAPYLYSTKTEGTTVILFSLEGGNVTVSF